MADQSAKNVKAANADVALPTAPSQDGVAIAVRPARPSPANFGRGPARAKDRKPAKAKHDRLVKAAAKAILPFVDPLAYGWKTPHGKLQITRDQLEAHYRALWRKRFSSDDAKLAFNDLVPKLKTDDIATHLRGGRELLVRSKWSGGRLGIRPEIDTHDGQTDGAAAMNALLEYIPEMYTCGSTNGFSGYLWLEVPTDVDHDTGELKPQCKLAEMNRLRETLHARVQALIEFRGFKAKGEVHGSFLKRNHDLDENLVPQDSPRVAEGAMGPGTTVKLPRFQTVEDVERFAAAVIKCNPRDLNSPTSHVTNHPGLLRLLADGLAAQKALKEAAAAANTSDQPIDPRHFQRMKLAVVQMSDDRIAAALGADEQLNLRDAEQLQRLIDWRPPAETGKRKEVTRIIILDHAATKLTADRACIVRARQILGITRGADFAVRQREVLELAHELYDENHLSANHRDRDREKRFESAFKYLVRTFDDDKAGAGDDPYWITGQDLDDIERKVKSTGPLVAGIETFNASPKAKRYGKLSARIIAGVMAVMAKNSELKDGAVLTKAIANMLAHPKYMGVVVHNTLIAAAKDIILGCKTLITRVAEAVAPIFTNGRKIAGRAARYFVHVRHWFGFLPAEPKEPQSTAPDAPRAPTTAGGHFFSLTQYRGSLDPTPPVEPTCMPTFNESDDANFAEYAVRGLI